MSKSRKALLTLSWHSVAYGLGTIGSQVVVYLLLPILTHSMSKEEYGSIPVIMSVYSFLNMLSNAGLPHATYHFYNNTSEIESQKSILGASQFLFFIFAAIPAVILFSFADELSLVLLNTEAFATALRYMGAYLVVETMNFYGNIILRIQTRALISSLHNVLSIGLKMGGAVTFVSGYGMGVDGYWLGYLVGSSLALLVMIWWVRDAIFFTFSKKVFLNLAGFGFPLIPSMVSMMILRISDRYIIGTLVGLEQVAVYDIGYKVGSLLLFLITPFRSAWAPFAHSIIQKPDASKIFRDVTAYLTAASVLIALVVISFRNEIISLLAPASYQEAANVVGWIAISHVFLALHPVFSSSLITQKKGYLMSWIALTAGVINIALNFLLIPRIGIVGAGISTLAGYGTLSFLSYTAGKRWLDIQIKWLKIGKISVAAIAAYSIVSMIESYIFTPWVLVLLKGIGLLVFPLLLLALRFVTFGQVKEIMDLVKNIRNRRKDKQESITSSDTL